MTRKLASGKKSTSWVFFEKRFEIPDYDNPKGEPSRIRWRLLHTPWFGIYIHKWNKPDPRPTLHNHPWNFISIILWGRYAESRHDYSMGVGNRFDVVKRWINIKGRSDFHTVIGVIKPTWSLMFVGKTHQDWGYKDKGKYISFDKHPHSKEFVDALKARKA